MKKKKLNSNRNFFIIFFFGLFLLIIAIVLSLYFRNIPNEADIFNQGEPATEFCSMVCDDDVIFSVNNSNYSFIRCQCKVAEDMGDGKYNRVINIRTHDFYYDAETLLNISVEEIVQRIKG